MSTRSEAHQRFLDEKSELKESLTRDFEQAFGNLGAEGRKEFFKNLSAPLTDDELNQLLSDDE